MEVAHQRNGERGRSFFAGRRIAVESRRDHLGNFRIAGSVVYALDTLGLGKDEVVSSVISIL